MFYTSVEYVCKHLLPGCRCESTSDLKVVAIYAYNDSIYLAVCSKNQVKVTFDHYLANVCGVVSRFLLIKQFKNKPPKLVFTKLDNNFYDTAIQLLKDKDVIDTWCKIYKIPNP